MSELYWPFSLYCVIFIFIEVYWYFVFMHAKSLQSCLTFCNSMDCSQPGSSVHRILQERILEWVAISFSRRSSWTRSFMSPALRVGFFTTSAIWEAHWYFGGGLVTKSWPTLTIPRTVALQVSLSMGFSRQEYWVGCHFLFQGIFPTQESNLDLLNCRQILHLFSYEGSSNWYFT